jgi:hypothetical protein
MPRGAILHVGCRKNGEGGFNGPVYGNGTFRYVPIPEGEKATERCWTYAELQLEDVLPKPWKHGKYAHYDPEFRDFTYGEPNTRKHGLRLRFARHLKEGDFLFFISSLTYRQTADTLKQADVVDDWAYYLIGFLNLAEDPINVPNPIPNDIRARFPNNAHIRRNEVDPLLIFPGTRAGRSASRLVLRARAISDGTDPNRLAREAIPWIRPRQNMGPTGWRYRWWAEEFVSEEGVIRLLQAVGVEP